jgi:hypothetical protein
MLIVLLQISVADEIRDYLLPIPKSLTINDGKLDVKKGSIIIPNSVAQYDIPLKKIIEHFKQTGIEPKLNTKSRISKKSLLVAQIDSGLSIQAYALNITNNNIRIKAGGQEGLYYALLTLEQIGCFAAQNGYWPTLNIEDEPDFVRRGVMLDISRDKVPKMSTLFDLIDKLEKWKINEIQLYTEHTFAYKNHEEVWKNGSPITSTQIQELVNYCDKYFIDLVPNQNSFGHMSRWLKHKKYEHLAELVEPGKTIWGMSSRRSLSPTEKGSIELMKELYAELLPNFTSPYFNIGCDETVELGVGKSKQMCEEIGKGQVYLNFLTQLKSEVDKYNLRVQFWGDIILHHPELIPELPKDMIALIWGYDEHYPFDKNCAKFKAAGLDYYVCPGTSSWMTIIGRNKNAFGNLQNAAINGKKHGAMGFLNTNWGDRGHWQPLSVSYPSFLYGAAVSWNVKNNQYINIPQQVSKQIFHDDSNISGEALTNIGNAYLLMEAPTSNSNVFFKILELNKNSIKTDKWFKKINQTNINKTLSYLNDNVKRLESAKLNCSDAEIIKKEVYQATQLAIHACHVAEAKLATSDGFFLSIPEQKKKALRKELSTIIESYKVIWLVRNRKGGLNDSVAKLEKVLKSYN